MREAGAKHGPLAKMRRNVISLVKFLLLAAFTVFLTVVVFRYARSPPSHRISTSLDTLATVAVDLRDDGNRGNEERSHQDMDKIDWHDYKKIEEEERRTGMGEHGRPAFLSPSLDVRKEKLYQVNGFNAALSDEISVNRSVPDIRHSDCKKKQYLKNLDPVSVIVSFHNEHFSTLLRTCWSVVNRSPPSLLEEIILVDDASTKIELKKKLDDYVAQHLPKVLIV